MILDNEKQRNLLLAILGEHIFKIPGKALVTVANEINDLVGVISHADIPKGEENGSTHTQETSEEETPEEA